MTVRSEDGPPSLEAAARQLGVEPEAVDADFGVVPIDVARGLYGVQVDAAQLPADVMTDEPFRGPFSTPSIEPFAPSRPEASGSRKKRE
jgi:hypothetical protein